jgi:hypothetical protein
MLLLTAISSRAKRGEECVRCRIRYLIRQQVRGQRCKQASSKGTRYISFELEGSKKWCNCRGRFERESAFTSNMRGGGIVREGRWETRERRT